MDRAKACLSLLLKSRKVFFKFHCCCRIPLIFQNLQVPGCQKIVRKVILQLTMIQWGILGLGDASAGAFLANHYPSLGPYFGNIEAQNWPHTPLKNMPTNLESEFNLQMMKITEIISNGSLENVSIMDFPAFGSKFAKLRLKHKIAPNWQTELNFAILQGNYESSNLFKNYKKLILDWKSYMEKFALGDPMANFTPRMKNNQLFKFTDKIKDDLTAFLIATHGSFLSADKQQSPVWTKLAKVIFNGTTKTSKMLDKNMYNQLIMKCAFKESLDREKKIHMDGACDGFYPTLTNNGFCYSFGGPKITQIWKSSNLTNAFDNTFTWDNNHQFFQGETLIDGKIPYIINI